MPYKTPLYTLLFQLSFSVQSVKLKDKIARCCGIFMDKFIKINPVRDEARSVNISDGDPYQWIKEMLGYQGDVVAAKELSNVMSQKF